jgi:hypothetical protein
MDGGAAPLATRLVAEVAVGGDRLVLHGGVEHGFLHLVEDLVVAFLLREVAIAVGRADVSLGRLVLGAAVIPNDRHTQAGSTPVS